MASRNVPQTLSPYLAGGALLGLPKFESSSLRPIAIGLVLRRLVGRLLMKALLQDTCTDIRSYLLPHQLAVGTKGGTEAIIHATREVLRVTNSEDVAVLLVDAKNAFNAIERSIILQQTILKAPGLARWVHYAYGKPSILLFGGIITLSMTGTQQGDPLSMLLFALALQPLINELIQAFPHLPLKAFYADDGTIVLNLSELPEVLAFLITRGADYGFNISLTKTKLWKPFHLSSHSFNPTAPLCTVLSQEAINLLGAPIGEHNAAQHLFLDRVNTVDILWKRLIQLKDPQIAYHILRHCASACRLVYALRCTPPQLTTSGAEVFDTGMRRVFQRTHRPLTDSAWKLATLPIRNGGLGLTLTTDLCHSAYISSMVSNAYLIQGLLPQHSFQLRPNIDSHITALNARFPLPENLQTQSLVQRSLSAGERGNIQHEFLQVITSASLTLPRTTRDRVRLQSVSTTNASRSFTTLPRSHIGTRAEPEVWSTIVDLRLGNPVYSGTSFCPRCAANRVTRNLDIYGHHASVCPAAEGTVRRHNGLRDKLYSLVASPFYGLQLAKEWHFPQDLHLPPKSRRKMDILHCKEC